MMAPDPAQKTPSGANLEKGFEPLWKPDSRSIHECRELTLTTALKEKSRKVLLEPC
jgi:hypothetical protein